MTTLGELPYPDALALQSRLRAARQADAIPDTLLLLEHPPTYTRGRRTQPGDLPMTADWYGAKGIAIHDADRGGQVTYHGPGQLVGYPIMHIASVHDFVHAMERALIATLADEGIPAEVRDGLTGVWTPQGKIASIGVHISRGVTTHGFAINVTNDLEPFTWIHPCGEDTADMTSIALEKPTTPSMPCFRKRTAHRFAETFALRQRIVSAHHLLRASAAVAAGRDDAQRSVRRQLRWASSRPAPTNA